jgi:8-oxo-dGTP pyrophosphatase MutT (NUDIX family)
MLRRIQLVLLRVYRALPRKVRRGAVHLLAPSFTVGAICVIERADGRVLLVRHSYRRRWGFPGGLVKRHEAIDVAARREAREEVGIDVVLVDEPAVVVAPGPRRVDVVYRARPADGADPETAAPMSPEILEVRWVTRDELPELQSEAADGLVALARRVAAG